MTVMEREEIPLVSICIPTYNSSQFIRETLDSLLQQTYLNCEIIASDNASSDDTCDILREYEDKYGIRVLYNTENCGAGENFNRLLAAAFGEYVCIYHADDLYHPTIVEESVKELTTFSGLGLVGTMAKAIDTAGKELFQFHLSVPARSKYTFDEAMVAMLNTAGSSIFFVTPSIMVPSNIFREVGVFNQELFRSSVDYEMWLRIARQHPVSIIDKPLMSYRLHEKQGSELEVRKNMELPDLYYVIVEYRKYLCEPAAYSACKSIMDKIVFKTALKQNSLGRFDQSSATSQKVHLFVYKMLSMGLQVANKLRINFGIRP